VLSTVFVCGLWREALRATMRSVSFSLWLRAMREAVFEENLTQMVP
jgi:hypothetical protein